MTTAYIYIKCHVLVSFDAIPRYSRYSLLNMGVRFVSSLLRYLLVLKHSLIITFGVKEQLNKDSFLMLTCGLKIYPAIHYGGIMTTCLEYLEA